ncbi:hypothetical protein C8R30_103104 [Nitrosomonas nitrosa]|mgnify:CR=1 FL=1|jgi:hypothetical protein|uniref:Uncharacterized protein n=1 Tax=Nitrosomonas nitrosa TaxID=52442 RepID=A0A1I4NCV1_9PROT|nr:MULTISPECIES: hypothetical protein [Nitrosomonas]MCO6433624.1 hypothetical protein [Nitrosomonas nitrosa]MCW5597915.1 hypothetical protein [Nitrosomonas sp.]MCW5600808.1 hypothetical protein [Nitrosomonas sp.]PTR04586.1 hypothetical protein C8R30_103104 [Nitrosomonas nitrosa]CAE6494646.1 conserved hypothetical protein [Nitrosomonas nitrosa]
MFIKLNQRNLFKSFVSKFLLGMTESRKDATFTNLQPFAKSPVGTTQTDADDAVWHRSKSARYQQNQHAIR